MDCYWHKFDTRGTSTWRTLTLCLWSEICFGLVLKFTLSNTRFQSLSRLELKRTILQAFKVEHFASQKWSGEWVELIQKYRPVTSLWCQTFVCRRGVFTWEKCQATQKWAIYQKDPTPRKEKREGENEEEEDEDVEIIHSQLTPYQNEPTLPSRSLWRMFRSQN